MGLFVWRGVMWHVGLLEWLGRAGVLAAQESNQAYGLAPTCGPATTWWQPRRAQLGVACNKEG
jgi:hypothetical protein